MDMDEFLEMRELLDAEKGKVYRPGKGVVISPAQFKQRTGIK